MEPEPGDMIRDPQLVFGKADEMATRFQKRLGDERKAAAYVSDDIISTLYIAYLDDLCVNPVSVETKKKQLTSIIMIVIMVIMKNKDYEGENTVLFRYSPTTKVNIMILCYYLKIIFLPSV